MGGSFRQRLWLVVALSAAAVLVSQSVALLETSAQEATCPGGSVPLRVDYGGQLVCPETGTITAGSVPPSGLALIVFGGGTSDQLVVASGCGGLEARFWVIEQGKFVVFIPASLVRAVNAPWFTLFEGGIPPNTPLIAACGL